MLKVKEFEFHNNQVRPLKFFFRYWLPIFIYTPVYHILIRLKQLFKPCKKQFKYKCSLCLIFKDEGHDLKEWLDYHILLGVDHFYLYNNFSSDNYKEILEPYINDGIVTLTEYPHRYAQIKAYSECYNLVKDETEWLGFIDADEYINLQRHDSISSFLDEFKLYPVLYLNWLMFGTSGHLHEDYSQLTIERYTQCWDFLCNTGKSFIHNTFDNFTISNHYSSCHLWIIPLHSVSAIKSVYINMHAAFTRGIGAVAFINHYWSRSHDFFHYKNFLKGDAGAEEFIKIRQRKGNFENNELRNLNKDFSILRWLTLLKIKGANQ